MVVRNPSSPRSAPFLPRPSSTTQGGCTSLPGYSLGPYSRLMPRALWWSLKGGLFFMSEVLLYLAASVRSLCFFEKVLPCARKQEPSYTAPPAAPVIDDARGLYLAARVLSLPFSVPLPASPSLSLDFYLSHKKQRPPWDPTVGTCLGPYGGPREVEHLL